jgi:hypothetical protein
MAVNEGLSGAVLDYVRKGNRVYIDDDLQTAVVTACHLLGPNDKIIGWVQQISNFSQQRNVYRVRHLNMFDAGTVLELVPGVSTTKISVQGLLLWPRAGISRDIVNRIGQVDNNPYGILDDSLPNFDIAIKIAHPNHPDEIYVVYRLYKCMMANWSMSGINIDGGNNVIMEQVNIEVARTGFDIKGGIEEHSGA